MKTFLALLLLPVVVLAAGGGFNPPASTGVVTGTSTVGGLTLGVSGSTASLTGTTTVPGGGTGLSSFSINSFFYAGGTTTFSQGVFGSDLVLTGGTLSLNGTNSTLTKLLNIDTITTGTTTVLTITGGANQNMVTNISSNKSWQINAQGGSGGNLLQLGNGSIVVSTARPQFKAGLNPDAQSIWIIDDNGDSTTLRLRSDFGTAISLDRTTFGVTFGKNASVTGTSTLGSVGSPVTFIRSGTTTLSAGVAVVTDTNVTANSRIIVELHTIGTVTLPSAYGVTARTPGTSFTISASVVTDTSVVDWWMWQP